MLDDEQIEQHQTSEHETLILINSLLLLYLMLNIVHLLETLFAIFDLFLMKNNFKNLYYDNASLEKIWNDKTATYTKEQLPNTN
jgi:hypothetical protein